MVYLRNQRIRITKYEAEARGTQKVLEAKAVGYHKLVEIVGDDKRLTPTLLMVEQLLEIIAQQVKAVQDLKIDKVTVWDGGGNGSGGKSATSNFLSGLINSLPAVHDLAKQAGVESPEFLGQIAPTETKTTAPSTPTNQNQ